MINIGADLGGMADATEMVTGFTSLIWTPVFAALIVRAAVLEFLRAQSRASSNG